MRCAIYFHIHKSLKAKKRSCFYNRTSFKKFISSLSYVAIRIQEANTRSCHVDEGDIS